MTVSPLYYMAHNPELALFSRFALPLGLALDPSTHLRQVDYTHRARAFRNLPFGSARERFDPDHSTLSEHEYVDLVTAPIDLARARGATLQLTAYHLTGPVGSRGRTLDLQIAADAISHFRAQRMDEPPLLAAVPVRREIFATIAVRADLLESASERRRLAHAYLELGADGFWVKIDGLSERARRSLIRASGSFFGLLRDDGRPVVSDGCGHLHVALLANEISTSVGLAESERFGVTKERSRDEWTSGRSRTIYHEKYLRSYRAGGEGAIRAFAGSSCRCGRHPGEQAPKNRAIEEHAAVVRAREAADALDGEIGERREWLLANAAMASHLAHDAGVDYTSHVVFEALFAGLDGFDAAELERTG